MLKEKKIFFFALNIISITFLFTVSFLGKAQCVSNEDIWKKLIEIENDQSSYFTKKLDQLYYFKRKFSECSLLKDSVYARLLHRIGSYEYGQNRALNIAIELTREAVNINNSGNKNSSVNYVTTSYYNLGFYYGESGLFDKALKYYDSSILFAVYTKQYSLIPDMRNQKAFIFFRKGDYQKAIEESTIGLLEAGKANDLSFAPALFNQRAQSYLMNDRTGLSMRDADSAAQYATSIGNNFQ